MKLKYEILKNNVVTHQAVVDSTLEGAEWVEENKLNFGTQDLYLNLEQLTDLDLLVENATSSSQQPIIVEGSEPSTETVYFFAKDWTVRITDVTAVSQKITSVEARTETREKCLKVIDLIALYNETALPETMDSIFSSPSMNKIILTLLTGAPKTAKAAILTMPAGLYSAEQVSEIVGQLDAIIASEGV